MEDEPNLNIKRPTFDFSRVAVVKNNRGSHRGYLLDLFLARINDSRRAAGYSPYKIDRLAAELAHLSIQDLDAFYKKCAAAKSFTAFYHWSLKVK